MSDMATGQVSSESLDKHLQHIRQLIVKEAFSLANANRPEATTDAPFLPREQDIWQAALKYAPGIPFPDQSGVAPSVLSRIFGFGGWTNTGTLAALTFVFGILGLVGVGLIGSAPVNSEVARSLSPFLDIAKIFAGAIVGAIGATAVASRRPSS